MRNAFVTLCIFILTIMASGCSKNDTKEAVSGSSVSASKLVCSNKSFQTTCPKKGDPIAIIWTDFGVIQFKLFPEKVPETFANFSTLASRGYYDNLTFHRVIKDFMIQGGDPNGDGSGGYSYKGPGSTIAEEFDPDLTHIYGALSMAKTSQPHTTGSQFFIVQNKEGAHWLDNQHSVFGQVYSGFEAVELIAGQQISAGDRPVRPIKMLKVIVTAYGDEENQ